MLLRPPISTLFPYTTLFRSLPGKDKDWQVRHVLAAPWDNSGYYFLRRLRSLLGKVARLCRDRKSTRLNSSHLGISYAVFCLKKKKIIQTEVTHHAIEI